jgi:hypothetical protein
MKLFIAVFTGCFAAVCQSQSTGSATARGTCNSVNTGNGNIVNQTCYGIDKKLADQFNELVSASKRDAKTLKDLLDKIDVLLKELPNPPLTSVTSINQQGGITAGQVTITQGQPPDRHLTLEQQQILVDMVHDKCTQLTVSIQWGRIRRRQVMRAIH